MNEPSWGDRIGDVPEPVYVRPCANCDSTTNEKYDKEMCKPCIEKYGIVPSTKEYLVYAYIPPRCKECMHNNPDWICIQNDGNEIWLACAWCGYPTLKD